jgi:tRNA1Val (adenine37-N6)-methyltransferase
MKQVRDFRFKQFTVSQERSTHKVGTDGVLLGAWVSVNNCKNILEIGTGSGVIALMLAQRTGGEVMIDAVEIQHEDARQAQENVTKSLWQEKISVHETAIQDFSSTIQYDVIVSNPPYFVNSWLPPNEQRTKVRHTSTLSFIELLQAVIKNLTITGLFALILPYTEAMQFIQLAESVGLHLVRQCAFKSRNHKPVERVLMEFSHVSCPLTSEHLVLYKNENGEEWSDEYKQLTKDFYLKI